MTQSIGEMILAHYKALEINSNKLCQKKRNCASHSKWMSVCCPESFSNIKDLFLPYEATALYLWYIYIA